MTLNFMNAVRVCREGEKLGRWGFFREALKIYLIYLSSLLIFLYLAFGSYPDPILMISYFLIFFCMYLFILNNWILLVKRLNDIQVTRWILLIYFIPYIGILLTFFILLCPTGYMARYNK